VAPSSIHRFRPLSFYRVNIQISVGSFGVWGLDSKNEVYFRDGTAGDADETEGSSWTMVFYNFY